MVATEQPGKSTARRPWGRIPRLAFPHHQNRNLHLALFAALVTALAVAIVAPSRGAPAGVSSSAAVQSVPGAPGGPISFTVYGDGLPVVLSTSADNVGQGLATAGIRVGTADLVSPSLDTHLSQGMRVYITYAKTVRVIVEGRERLVQTRSGTVGALLGELGMTPQPTDRIFPGLEDPVRQGMSVSMVTFRDGVDFTDEPLAYETVYQDDPNLLKGQTQVVQAGVEGYVRREFKTTSLNGSDLEREMVGETWVWPTNEVVAVGTRAPVTPAPVVAAAAPVVSFEGMSCVRTLNVYATWYTAASAGGGGTTATGTGVYKGIVAVDPKVIPLGTRLWIPRYGYAVAADTGGGVKGAIIDLGYGPNDLMDWVSRYMDICILG